MQAHILSLHAPSATGIGSKGQKIFFLKVAMSHIKLECAVDGAPSKISCSNFAPPTQHSQIMTQATICFISFICKNTHKVVWYQSLWNDFVIEV